MFEVIEEKIKNIATIVYKLCITLGIIMLLVGFIYWVSGKGETSSLKEEAEMIQNSATGVSLMISGAITLVCGFILPYFIYGFGELIYTNKCILRQIKKNEHQIKEENTVTEEIKM